MIDLSEPKRLLRASLKEANELHGINVEDPDAVAHKRRFAADVSRDMLHLADQLDLTAALVRQQYWSIKGYS